MSTITSIDEVRPGSPQNINQIRPVSTQSTGWGNQTGTVGNVSGNFQTVFSQAILDEVRKDKISSSDNGQYDAIFAQASACYNLPVALLKAITKVESDFNPYDVSSKGAKGLMQLMPSTAEEVGVTDPFDPWQNIMGATKYIRKQLDRFGDLRVALAAYNTGPGNVKKYGGEPSYCKRYVDKVLAYMGEAEVNTGNVGAAYDVLANQGSSYNSFLGSFGNTYSGTFGGLGSLGTIYNLLGNQSGYGMLGNLGSSYGISGGLNSSLGMLGSLGSSSSLLGNSGSLLGSSSSSLGLLSNSSGYNSLYALSSLLATSAGNTAQGSGDTVTLSREGFNSLIELMRIQSMMSSEQTVGSMSLI